MLMRGESLLVVEEDFVAPEEPNEVFPKPSILVDELGF